MNYLRAIAASLWERFWPPLVGGAFGGLIGSLLAFGLWSLMAP